jgi:hypothetical protein
MPYRKEDSVQSLLWVLLAFVAPLLLLVAVRAAMLLRRRWNNRRRDAAADRAYRLTQPLPVPKPR